jgi:hypothetical protein
VRHTVSFFGDAVATFDAGVSLVGVSPAGCVTYARVWGESPGVHLWAVKGEGFRHAKVSPRTFTFGGLGAPHAITSRGVGIVIA